MKLSFAEIAAVAERLSGSSLTAAERRALGIALRAGVVWAVWPGRSCDREEAPPVAIQSLIERRLLRSRDRPSGRLAAEVGDALRDACRTEVAERVRRDTPEGLPGAARGYLAALDALRSCSESKLGEFHARLLEAEQALRRFSIPTEDM